MDLIQKGILYKVNGKYGLNNPYAKVRLYSREDGPQYDEFNSPIYIIALSFHKEDIIHDIKVLYRNKIYYLAFEEHEYIFDIYQC